MICLDRDEKKCSRVSRFLRCMLSKKSPHRKQIHNLTPCKPSQTFWQVALDIMRTLFESKRKFFLITGSQFTKWYEATPMSNQETSTVAKAFLKVLVLRFVCPAKLHSDKGNKFSLNFSFKNICKELGINGTSTTAYQPQGKAMIERPNCTINGVLQIMWLIITAHGATTFRY